MEYKEKMKETEKCLDSQLWHACAGSIVQMPQVNTKVFYFPQGHAEHACGNVDFSSCLRIPAYVPCRVSAIKFMADPETDEVFVKTQLVPVNGNEFDSDYEDIDGNTGSENPDKPMSFAKTLTQSDANNGGGFSVPRYCAETLFPRLDYTADPPVQTILAKDVHGVTWKLRHIYRGTPRRHLLTTGWSAFVNHKKLVAGDSIVFLRAENGDLCVGIRRARREIGVGHETGWNSAMPLGGFSSFMIESENKLSKNGNQNLSGGSTGQGRVKAESVIEAATLAAAGQPFEVVYYPRASTPEFCVKASLVKMALQIQWHSGMRFKMAFETEDSSRISWFMGTISTAQVFDPHHWPDSPWRLLQVTWDEPDLLQNVKNISPWLVTSMSTSHLSPFSPPQKKPRLPQHPEFPLNGQFPLPAFSSGQFTGFGNLFTYLHDNTTTPASMQGARHAQNNLYVSDLYLNKLQSGFFPIGFLPLDQTAIPKGCFNQNTTNHGSTKNVSCLQTMGNSISASKNSDHGKATPFVLFGQPILTEQQISWSNNSSIGNSDKMENTFDRTGHVVHRHGTPERSLSEGFHPNLDLDASHCKVFMESENVGRIVNLSLLGSYEELCRKLASMFGIDSSEIVDHVHYHDVTGVIRQLGDESFSDFSKKARRLRILTDSSSVNVGM